MQNKTDIGSLTYEELKEIIKGLGQPAYRADQVFSWLHEKCVRTFDEMTNLPAALRKSLAEICDLPVFETLRVQESAIDGTRKYLFGLADGNTVESVLMHYSHGNSVCVSSQVGCDMGCRFCASTLEGCVRNLTAWEILRQVYEIQSDTGERVSNVVIMGMGEPLVNYNNVIRFINILSHEKSLHISQRNITMSTCGIVPAIIKLSKEDLKITLALSLHAPDDATRRKIMPIAEKYSIHEVLDACEEYFKATGRRVTFEYCLIGDLNDGAEHARTLVRLLKGMNAHVNLIPLNPVEERDLKAPKEQNIRIFRQILEDAHITVTRRREMGRDISGACGQLRRQVSRKNAPDAGSRR